MEFESLLTAMQQGDEIAFGAFFETHYERIVRYAKKRIGTFPLRVADEEDIAISAMNSLFRNIEENRYDIQNSMELWKLLVTITNRKLSKQRHAHFAQKRGGGKVRGDSIWQNSGSQEDFVQRPQGGEMEWIETTDVLFQRLDDPKAREVARLLLEGHSIEDVAVELGCVRRTVERKIASIRVIWSEFLNEL